MMRKKAKRKPGQKAIAVSTSSPSYVLTDADRAAAREQADRRKQRPQLAGVEVTKSDSSISIGWKHPLPVVAQLHFANVLKTDDQNLATGIHMQLARATTRNGTIRADDVDLAIAIVRAIEPRDPTEALLATQMAAIHMATLKMGQNLASAETILQQDSVGRLLSKLARTFSAQVEALKRYRSTGEQHIKVQHVTVNDGGQAIVGNVQTGGGDAEKSEDQPHELGSSQTSSRFDATGTPLLGDIETNSSGVQGARHERLDGMPKPRGARRRTKRH